MAFYENTIVAKQDLSEKEIESLINKYDDLISNSSGKVIKIEKWGLLNLSKKIKNNRKGYFVHFKFEGINQTVDTIKNKIKIDGAIIRNLTVKYKKLDINTELFNKNNKSK